MVKESVLQIIRFKFDAKDQKNLFSPDYIDTDLASSPRKDRKLRHRLNKYIRTHYPQHKSIYTVALKNMDTPGCYDTSTFLDMAPLILFIGTKKGAVKFFHRIMSCTQSLTEPVSAQKLRVHLHKGNQLHSIVIYSESKHANMYTCRYYDLGKGTR